jgi:two-component system sensor histidine kinase UhpB
VSIDRLSSEVETACFRIVQEAITNVVRHSHASNVFVDLKQQNGGQIFLTIKDNGDGFEPSLALARWGANSRLGLAGMRERVRLLGGTIDIRSRPGAGTQIEVVFHCDMLAATSS